MSENKLFQLYSQKYYESRSNLDIFTNPTKKKIITAAIDLFAKIGYENTSMRDLADAVGIKAASIYNHFASKHDILLEIFDIQSKMLFFFVNWDFGEGFSAREILSCIFEFSIIFEPDELKIFQKIIRILVMEQYREPLAYEAFTHYMLIDSSKLYKKMFDKLIDQKKMKPFNTACFSKVLVSSLYAYVIEASHYYNYEDLKSDRENIDSLPSLLEVKKYLYGLILPE